MVEVPWFEDFEVGNEYSDVPAITLTEGYAALHQSVFADRSRLYLDAPLCRTVTGSDRLLVNPSLVCNITIGQSTIPSQRVLGNLFYRGLRFHRPVFIGDTLTTTTKVVALRQNSIKPGRAASGMVGLEIHTCNQDGETVLLFWRCPMISCRDPDADTGLKSDFSMMPEEISGEDLLASVPDWRISAMTKAVGGRCYETGQVIEVEARDTVTSAPEMVRMTLNLAMTHTDATKSVYNRRLVYGGHTISLAAAQLSRVMPDLVTILAWFNCDHVAPVFENDILGSVVTIEDISELDQGRLARLTIEVFAERGADAPESGENIKVLDWRLAALLC